MMALMYGGVSLGYVAVLLRFASMRISKTRLHADDWTIVTAWVREGFSAFLFPFGSQERLLMGLGKRESDAHVVCVLRLWIFFIGLAVALSLSKLRLLLNYLLQGIGKLNVDDCSQM